MGRASQRGPLTARIWLTIVVFCQIFLTPMAAFSITYLLQLDMTGETVSYTHLRAHETDSYLV